MRSCYWVVGLVLGRLGLLTDGSPFDPHVVRSGKSFFEGWYVRVVDHDNELSVAVIVGSMQLEHGRQGLSESWAVLLVNEKGAETRTEQIFPSQPEVSVGEGQRPVVAEPDLTRPAVFTYSTSAGALHISDSTGRLALTFPSFSINVTLSSRIPWSESQPNGDGPESYLRYIAGLVPCHYYVHSLGSKAQYALLERATGKIIGGSGFAHLETNYGTFFPSAWAWAQGISTRGQERFVMTAGRFLIAGKARDNFALRYQSTQHNLTFRSPDLDGFAVQRNACNGTLVLEAHDYLRTHRAMLYISAAPATFSQKLYFPTPLGFSNNPGCVESFAATAEIHIFKHGVEQQVTRFELSALEFGGDFLCHSSSLQQRVSVD